MSNTTSTTNAAYLELVKMRDDARDFALRRGGKMGAIEQANVMTRVEVLAAAMTVLERHGLDQ